MPDPTLAAVDQLWSLLRGDRYTACGVSWANRWLLIDFGSQIGYAYMTCLKDV
ncbi:hypothetical protein [Micromonospora sp. NPDC005367]|uniref:hypothetical protein n=1 Tax=Micromonospora sp. NPDC005367 TaxID=3155590 RepID=UPI0033AA5794